MGAAPRVAVALSGGVDSATAAALLLEQGWEVIGLTMQLWDHGRSTPAGSRTCCALEDVHDARQVAQTLGIPFYVVDFEAPFRATVVADFIATYARGQTPNPCIRCNQNLKFDRLLGKARALGADFLATGHYAEIRHPADGPPQLWRGRDRDKDQSYFLFATTPAQLRHLLFPLGALRKEETRALAARFGLHLATKRDSQDVCFVPDGDLQVFFRRHAPALAEPGPIVDRHGTVLGRHRGLGCHTIGQRRGLGLGQGDGPWYVSAIDPATNQLVVGPERDLYKEELQVRQINWLGDGPLDTPRPVQARIRYAARPEPALLIPLGEEQALVRFTRPQRAITPGQACVFHQGERLLGGGWIT
ncbi:MAG: tRNA 2-thiouridine(34) synthase MnmA [Magnetococcales bacterium]|nr:tRNA 2-thiouridine(34) synthase MnmA [Magnetococcales bacterium]